MELNTEDAKSVADSSSPDPSSEIARILEVAQRQLEEEFRRRLESAVQAAASAAIVAAGTERDEAISRARTEVTAELRAEFDQTLLRTITQLQSDFERKMRVAREQWDEEKLRVEGQLNLWKSYAEAQRLMTESKSQTEILSHFLQRTEVFAPNLAVYISKPDGLALWKTRGDGPFPNLISQNTSDPEAFFKAVVVRGRTLAAVSARPPFDAAPLGYLSDVLERAIEAFGLRLESSKARSVAS
jgi:hypothetical protein